MIKKEMAIITALLLTIPAYGQKEDSGYIEYETILPSVTYGSDTINAILNFNDSTSMYCYRKYGLDDSVRSESLLMADPGKGVVMMISGYDETGEVIYRNFSRKEIIYRAAKRPPLPSFVVHDEWLDIHWEIGSDSKIIKGLECKKATGKFRGRTYTAWFTEEIPYRYGPWKLFGLPGVIIAATDAEHQVVFNAKNICYPCSNKDNIMQPREDVIKSIKEYVGFKDHLLENVRDTMQAKAPEGIHITLENVSSPATIHANRQYAMEKVYEWESADSVLYPEFPARGMMINKD